MIIECINCNKKFDVNSELIPSTGRTMQCGSCNHVWFFDKTNYNQKEISNNITQKENEILTTINDNKRNKIKTSIKSNEFSYEESSNIDKNKNKKIISPKHKSNLTFFKFLSYIVVLIISLVGLIIIIDTFKVMLYSYFPKLEFLLFSFFETLKDIELFFKDLI